MPGELDRTRHQSVLRGPIEEGTALQDAGHCEECGRRYLQAQLRAQVDSQWRGPFEAAPDCSTLARTHLDGTQQVLSSVIAARDQFAKALCVRCPQHDDFVQPCAGPEVADVLADLLQLGE